MKAFFLRFIRRTAFVAVVCLSFGSGFGWRGLAADAESGLGLKLFADGFTSPVALVPIPDGSGRMLVVDQIGVAFLVDREGTVDRRPFLDLRRRMVKLNEGFDERGLLGLAFHPEFEVNRKFYVYYSAPLRSVAPRDWDHTAHLSEIRVTGDGDGIRVEAGSERVLLEVDHPFFNHNGGALLFGPDGYLYLSIGDGGNANDVGKRGPQGNAQDLMTVLGKILRIDVDGGEPYGIPGDNPFQDAASARPEIYAYGLRNVWRMSFDRGGNHELFAGDVGQNLFEEIDIIVRGGNYGWNIREGLHGFNPEAPGKPAEDRPKVGLRGEPLLDPILEYRNRSGWRNDPSAAGISIAGGYVYRGKALPELTGQYVFGDWSRSWSTPEGVLFVATRPSAGTTAGWAWEPLSLKSSSSGVISEFLLAFGEDAEGELYLLTNNKNSPLGRTGKVFKLVRM